jgi:hypothetical protein
LHIFIDESGSFSGYHDRSISVVGALAIPDGKLALIKRKYSKIRAQFPMENGEVKGRLLDEQQVNAVIELLVRNEVLFEITAIDLGIQKRSDAEDHKKKHGEEMLARANRFREPDRGKVERASRQILTTSLPLYLQAIVTFEVLHKIINHVPLYFAQRQPHELGSFTWIVDGKDPDKVTNWEMWWSWYAQGALATMSISRPAPRMKGADFSHFDRFRGHQNSEDGTDNRLLLADLRFSATVDPGLELVDIVVNATRRALVDSLKKEGWHSIPRLIIHRKEAYIQFLVLGEGPDTIHRTAYGRIVNRYFSSGGRLMLAPRFLREYRRNL